MNSLVATNKGSLNTQWAVRHNDALVSPKGFERDLIAMMHALDNYAYQHKIRYESAIGEDYMIGDAWTNIAKGLLMLLNGETGRLDCGTCDAFIRNMATEHGIDLDK